MEPINRRTFIARTGAVVAAAGAAVLVPTQLVGAVVTRPSKPLTGAAVEKVPVVDIGSESGPIIAHVRNLQAGELSIYCGTNEFTLYDRDLASRLARATGGK